MSVQSISRGFVYDHSFAIVATSTLAVPLAIEVFSFLKAFYKDPSLIKKRLSELKTSIYYGFHQKDDETQAEFKVRFRRNATIAIFASIGIAGAAAFPYFVFPAAFALPIALSAVYSIGKIFQKIQQNPNMLTKVKNYLKDAFTQRPNELLQDFQERRWKAIKKITFYSLLFSAVIATSIVVPYVGMLLSKYSSVWAMSSMLPLQNKAFVFGTYFTVGLMHAVQCARYWKKDKTRALFHATAALSAVAFPLFYNFTPGQEMRLHHSIIGLTLQLAPSQAMRTLGTAIAIDSSMYAITPLRGGINPATLKFEEYDIMNAIYGNFPFVIQNLVLMSLVEKFFDFLKDKKDKKDKKEVISAVSFGEGGLKSRHMRLLTNNEREVTHGAA